jgi:hypothetical protein
MSKRQEMQADAQLGVGNPVKPSKTLGEKAASMAKGVIAGMKEAWDNFRIGDGHASGMLRLGAHEATQALVALPDSNIRPMEEPGVFGNNHMPQHDPSFDKEMEAYANRVTNHDQARGMER